MRNLLLAAAAGAAALGGAAIAPAVHAQPYDYYRPAPAYEPAYRYDDYGRRYDYDEAYRPGYAAPMAGAVIGSTIYDTYGRVPVDRFGPDPNGMIAPDGHRIKCKLRDTWDDRFDRYMTRRVCD
ncbi:MAG TPA: hypothetical protein VGC92_09045 [Phenylobacterium sp.]|jgi:hypothetical protein